MGSPLARWLLRPSQAQSSSSAGPPWRPLLPFLFFGPFTAPCPSFLAVYYEAISRGASLVAVCRLAMVLGLSAGTFFFFRCVPWLFSRCGDWPQSSFFFVVTKKVGIFFKSSPFGFGLG
jgi:hypothetical protein